jgi:DNA-binding NarL/FixJ family response regulator
MINLIIVDDNRDIRQYFKLILSQERDLNVMATAATGKEGVQLTKKYKPDVVLMDIQMETETAGIDAAHVIRQISPATKVIILTIHTDDQMLFKAYNAGVMDYIIKTDSIVQIINSIHKVHQNNLMLRSDVAEKIISEFNRIQDQNDRIYSIISILTRLTNSEFEILRCVYEGLSYKEIARSRFVSDSTIKSQVNSILKKFDVPRMKNVIAMLKIINFERTYQSSE